MERKLLMNVSHEVEAIMFQQILEDAGIPCYISEQNGPYVVELYLGQQNPGVDLYVEPEDYDRAKELIEEAQIQD